MSQIRSPTIGHVPQVDVQSAEFHTADAGADRNARRAAGKHWLQPPQDVKRIQATRCCRAEQQRITGLI